MVSSFSSVNVSWLCDIEDIKADCSSLRLAARSAEALTLLVLSLLDLVVEGRFLTSSSISLLLSDDDDKYLMSRLL